MAFQPIGQRSYIQRMGQAYALVLVATLAFLALMAVLEFVGTLQAVLGFLLAVMPLLLYAFIGVSARSLQVVEFFSAGRRIPAGFAGMASAANWIGATMLLGLSGALAFNFFGGLSLMIGWAGGFVIVTVLFAPYLRKFGAFTVTDFLAARFESATVRIVSVVMLVASASFLLVAEVRAGGLLASRMLNLDVEAGVGVCVVVVLFCTVLGGIRSVSWTQAAQYIVMGLAVALPVVLVSVSITGNPLAPFAVEGLFSRIAEMEAARGMTGVDLAVTDEGLRSVVTEATNLVARPGILTTATIVLSLMLGSAVMPHVLMRSFVTTSAAGARRAGAWTIVFIAAIFMLLPAAAAFVKFIILQDVIGARLSELPAWVGGWAEAGLMRVTDTNRNGLVGPGEFLIHPDAVLLAMPEMRGLPYVLTAFLGAGLLAAAIATASGLVHAVASALSHDVYYRFADRTASTAKRLVAARLIVVMVAVGAAYLALGGHLSLLPLLGWATSIAAASSFPVLFLAIWWRRANAWGAICAMISGFAVTAGYLVGLRFFDVPVLLGVNELAAGLPGVIVGLLTGVVVSLATAAPGRQTASFIDNIRLPSGRSIMESERAAERIREAGSAR